MFSWFKKKKKKQTPQALQLGEKFVSGIKNGISEISVFVDISDGLDPIDASGFSIGQRHPLGHNAILTSIRYRRSYDHLYSSGNIWKVTATYAKPDYFSEPGYEYVSWVPSK